MFEVGQKVIVKNLGDDKAYEMCDTFAGWIQDMRLYIGKILTIQRINNNKNVSIENNEYIWSPNWLEPIPNNQEYVDKLVFQGKLSPDDALKILNNM